MSLNRIAADKSHRVIVAYHISCLLQIMLQLHGAIYRSDSFVLMPHYCANLKAIRYESTTFSRVAADKLHRVIVAYHISCLLQIIRLQLHGAIYRFDSFVLMPHYCANLKATRYESTIFNRTAADKSHRVIVA